MNPIPALNAEMLAAMAADRAARGPNAGDDLAAQRRAGLASAQIWCRDLPEMQAIEDRMIAGGDGPIRVRIYHPQAAATAPLPVLLVVHGGAFIVGSIEQAEPVARQLAATLPAIVISASYRLAPEHPFPAGLEDVAAALRFAQTTARELDAEARPGILGISAGANLAAAALLAAPDAVAAAVFVYGLFSPDTETPSHRQFGGGAYGLSSQRIVEAFAHYLPPDTGMDDPRIAPLRGDLSTFPPTLLIAAECDPLLDDSRQMTARLQEGGREAELAVYAGVAHGFINKGTMVGAARTALTRISGFLADRLTAAAPFQQSKKERLS